MTLSFGLGSIHCPECQARVQISGSQIRNDPDHYTGKCSACGAVVEVKRNPATGKLESSATLPA